MFLSAGLILGAAAAFDLARAPGKQLSARGADALIAAYQTTVSPLLEGAGVRCRFLPSCSEYARATIRDRGLAAGGLRSLMRLARCGPWTPAGTVDPPTVARVLTRGEERAAKRRPR